MICKVNEDGSLSEVASNGGGLINDEKTSENETWSSKKINDSLVGLEDNEIRRITKAENTASDFSIDSHEGSWITKYIEHELLAGHGTFPSEAYEWIQIEQYKSYDFVRQICTIYNSSGLTKTFIRGAWCNGAKIENAVWSDWKELATKDYIVAETKVVTLPINYKVPKKWTCNVTKSGYKVISATFEHGYSAQVLKGIEGWSNTELSGYSMSIDDQLNTTINATLHLVYQKNLTSS